MASVPAVDVLAADEPTGMPMAAPGGYQRSYLVRQAVRGGSVLGDNSALGDNIAVAGGLGSRSAARWASAGASATSSSPATLLTSASTHVLAASAMSAAPAATAMSAPAAPLGWPAAPVVRIEIGRVEIRAGRPAQRPPAPSHPERPASRGRPAPDLAEYLAMSDARAIEAVTQTLRAIVDAGVKNVAGSGAQAITLPPHEITASNDLRVNVFLYQAEIDPALRNTDPHSTVPGEGGQPALPLILHYLITPYAPDGDEIRAHRLLGGALQALQSHPLLTPADLADAAPYSDISRQVESVRVCWQPLEEKDIYSLWSIFQAPYRVSAAFELRVVLIDSTAAGRAALPVLRRGGDGRGPVVSATVGYPEITTVVPPLGQPAALPGDRVRLLGTALGATTVFVLLSHPRLAAPLRFRPDSATGAEVAFTVPATMPSGSGTVTLSLSTPGTSDQLSNDAPVVVCPEVTSPLPAITLTCRPAVRAGQQVVLLLGGTPVASPPVTAETTSLTFTVGPLPAGKYPLRLRVDGVDSRLIADRTKIPPGYDPARLVTVTP